jgi:hypothetical protein
MSANSKHCNLGRTHAACPSALSRFVIVRPAFAKGICAGPNWPRPLIEGTL